ncbi:MAG: hypothetical protein FD144_2656 [Rhodospirillaceae bacterium]|nr:MAG: hypothetical protein FD144_2656 [Rhodospirillaceae bacterium]
MNRQPVREHRIPTSLERHMPRRPVSEGALRKLVAEAREAGVVVFLEADLARLPDISRRLIETEHKRLCERR